MASAEQSGIQVLVCSACQRRTSVVAGTGKLMVESLPDPFEFSCPTCGATKEMSKSAVQTISLSGGK
jgi:hypothetical protein